MQRVTLLNDRENLTLLHSSDVISPGLATLEGVLVFVAILHSMVKTSRENLAIPELLVVPTC